MNDERNDGSSQPSRQQLERKPFMFSLDVQAMADSVEKGPLGMLRADEARGEKPMQGMARSCLPLPPSEHSPFIAGCLKRYLQTGKAYRDKFRIAFMQAYYEASAARGPDCDKFRECSRIIKSILESEFGKSEADYTFDYMTHFPVNDPRPASAGSVTVGIHKFIKFVAGAAAFVVGVLVLKFGSDFDGFLAVVGIVLVAGAGIGLLSFIDARVSAKCPVCGGRCHSVVDPDRQPTKVWNPGTHSNISIPHSKYECEHCHAKLK